MVELNRAVAVAMDEGPERGLELLERIEGLERYHLLHAARADLLRRLEPPRRGRATRTGGRSTLADSSAERAFLDGRLAEVAASASARRPPRPGVAARSTPSTAQPGSSTTTGRPSRRAKAISASVPQLPPTAIAAAPEATTARFRAWPMPGDDDVVDPRVRVLRPLAGQDPDRRPARLLRAARRGRHHLAAAARDDGVAGLGEQPARPPRRAPRAPRPEPITEICTALMEQRRATS